MLIAPPLRNTEKRVNLEASVPSEGQELDPEAAPQCNKWEDERIIAQIAVSLKAQGYNFRKRHKIQEVGNSSGDVGE